MLYNCTHMATVGIKGLMCFGFVLMWLSVQLMYGGCDVTICVAYLTLEQQLESLGQHWGTVCRAVERRGTALEKTVALWASFNELYARFCDWLSRAEASVWEMEAVGRSTEMTTITEQVQQLKVVSHCDN